MIAFRGDLQPFASLLLLLIVMAPQHLGFLTSRNWMVDDESQLNSYQYSCPSHTPLAILAFTFYDALHAILVFLATPYYLSVN